MDIVGTPLASFAKIMATSNRMEVFNGICGAESGNVPVATIAPALLVSEIEVQRKDSSRDRPAVFICRRPSSSPGSAPVRRCASESALRWHTWRSRGAGRGTGRLSRLADLAKPGAVDPGRRNASAGHAR